MAVTPADVIRIATAEVGYREGRSDGHWNNKTKYAPAVPGLEWADWQAWCATFMSWVAMKAGAADLFPRTASCVAGVAWFRTKGQWSEYPAIGSQVFFGPGGGTHTGLVVDYDANTITTIEGNTNTSGSAEGDGVYRKTRQRRDTYVYGYGYPAYAAGLKTADPTWKNPSKQQEDPMAGITKKDIFDAVWKTDAIGAPSDAADVKTNPTWQPQSILKDVQARIRSVDKRMAAQTAAITALAGQIGKGADTKAVVAAVDAAIERAVIDVNINTKAV